MTRLRHLRATLLASLATAVFVVLGSSVGLAASTVGPPVSTTTTTYLLTSQPPTSLSGPTRDILITGDCGKVNFINYGSGHFYVIVDSFKGSMWWIDWHVQSATAGTGGTRYPNRTHDEWSGHVGVPFWPQALVLTGDAFTSGAGYCYFVPNPA